MSPSRSWCDYDVALDARQLECPLPLLKCKLAMRDMCSGQVLWVQATDAGSWRDIPTFIEHSASTLLDARQYDGVYHYWIQIAP